MRHEGVRFLQGETSITGKAWTYTASYGRQSLNGDNLGMALLFKREDRDAQTEDNLNYVSVMRPAADKTLEYYFLAAWEAEPGGITNEQNFIRYLEQEAERLTEKPEQNLTKQPGPHLTLNHALQRNRKTADSRSVSSRDMPAQNCHMTQPGSQS